MNYNKWDIRFLNLAKLISTWSKDPSTQCGAVITKGKEIISVGFNGFPKNTSDNNNLYQNRQEKYKRIIHAEINAIAFAKRDLTNCTIYVYPMQPCSQCTALIIQSGIKRIVTLQPSKDTLKRWEKSFNIAQIMLIEAQVELKYIYNIN